MDNGVAITNQGVSVGTSSTQVLLVPDTNTFDTFDLTISNNSGGVITAADLQGYNSSGWHSLDATNLTSNLVPLGPGATLSYSTDVGLSGYDKIRLMLTGSANVNVDVNITGYTLGARS
jgi:hypothetical protein